MFGLIINIIVFFFAMMPVSAGGRKMLTITTSKVDQAFGKVTPLFTFCEQHAEQAQWVASHAFPDSQITLHKAPSDAQCTICNSSASDPQEQADKLREHYLTKYRATISAASAQAQMGLSQTAQAAVLTVPVPTTARREEAMPIYTKEEVYDGKLTHVHAQRYDGNYVSYDNPVGYSKGELIWAAGLNSTWRIRIYDTDEVSFAQIKADIQDVGSPTYKGPSNSGGFIALWIYNADGTIRDWMDLGPVEVTATDKALKRLSVFRSDSWLHADFSVEADIDIEFTYSCNIEEKEGFDGNVFISYRLRDLLIDMMIERADDKESAIARAKKMRDERVFQIRVLTRWGLIKGHALVGKTGGPDIVVHIPDNFKSELRRTVPGYYIHLVPESQYKPVVSDRQALSIAGRWLFDVPTPGREGSLGLIRDALVDKIDHLISKLRRGVPIHFEQEEVLYETDLANMDKRLDAFYYATGSVNDSMYFTQMSAERVVRVMTPNPESYDKKISYPVPFASRVSLRTEASYEFAACEKLGRWDGSVRHGLSGNVVAFTPLGFVFSDEIRSNVLFALGGADLDDKAVCHIRIAENDDEHFGIKAGDIVIIIIRPPSGSMINTHEFWIAKVSLDAEVSRTTFLAMLRSFGIRSIKEAKSKLPKVRLGDARPTCVTEVEFPEPTIEWMEPVFPAEGITEEYMDDLIEVMSEYSHVYGGHASIAMACAEANIPVPFHAMEEDWVDYAQQKPYGPNLIAMDEANEADRQLLIDHQVALEWWYAKRAGLADSVPTYNGFMSELIEFHKEQLGRYTSEARKHVIAVKAVHEARAEELINPMLVSPSRTDGTALKQYGQMPLLLARLVGEVKQYVHDHRGMTPLKVMSDEAIMSGIVNRVYDKMMAAVSQEEADKFIMESFLGSHQLLEEIKGGTSVRVYSYGDHHLMFGKVFSHLLDLLVERGSTAEDWKIWAEGELPF